MKSLRWVFVLLPLWLALPVSLPGSLSAAPFAYIAQPSSATVWVLDTATDAVTATVPVGWYPFGVAVARDGARVYVTNRDSDTVSVIATATNTVIATVTVGATPLGVAVAPDGRRVYVVNVDSDTLSVIDTKTATVTRTVAVGSSPRAVAVTPDGTCVYVTNWTDGTVSVIGTATNTVIATVPVGAWPTGVAMSPDGTRAYVTNWATSTVSVIETAMNTVTATVPVGASPFGIAVSPDGARVYVANVWSHTVSVIAAATHTVIATVPVGLNPQHPAVTPSGARVYVTNSESGTVSVIAVATNEVVNTISAGTYPAAFGLFIGPDLRDRVGVFRPSDGTFYLDYNGTGTWEGCGTDRCLQIGLNGDIPLVGDWNGTGSAKVGLFRPADGTFYLDYNLGNTWEGCGTDRCLQIGLNGDVPLVGDWNGSGTSKVGAFRPSDGTFYLDYNGNGVWEGCGVDRCLQIGMLGDIPLVGDWNGSGTSKVGAFRPSDGTFYLDYNGSGTWEGCGTDRCLSIGMNGDIPLVGDWDGTGSSKVGAFRPSDGTFYLDYNGSGTWEGCGTDRCLQIGMNGDKPLVGKW